MKRYDIKFTGTYPIAEMAEHPNGAYVAHADHVDRVKQLDEALRDAERFIEYFAGETRGAFEGPGTPQKCLASIRDLLNGGSNERT